jgi:hypothetical protein
LLLLAAVGFGWAAHKSRLEADKQAKEAEARKKEAVAAQERTVREMIQATWKAGSYVQDEKESASNDPAAEEKVYAATGSYIPGSRWLYARLKTLMDLEKMKSLAPVPIFLSGPHVSDFNFRSYDDFGRYNPAFVRWASDNLIPAASDPAFRKLTAPVYQKQLKEAARIYYLAYLNVEKRRPEAEAIRAKYLESVQAHHGVHRHEGKPDDSFNAGPGQVLQTKFSEPFEKEFTKGEETSRSYRWTTDQAFYFASTAPGFWIRRQIDGTAPDFFAGLKKLLETYDADFLKDPSAP